MKTETEPEMQILTNANLSTQESYKLFAPLFDAGKWSFSAKRLKHLAVSCNEL